MKNLSNKFNTVITLLLLTTILCSSSSQAVSAEFDRNKLVDSNSWTKMASAKKSTSYNYCAIYLRKMLDANKSENNNYVNLYARMSQNQTTVIEKQVAGYGEYSKGVQLLVKGKKSIYLLKKDYRTKGEQINIFLKGHNPKYDCYANGTWNIDRANLEY
ncbi:MAG: hypothetical protein BHW05_08210 [Clostridium sp. 42_12]|nr:MAG: hypothetical protein BHW05_08210 [Clostridium sp. 42_12]